MLTTSVEVAPVGIATLPAAAAAQTAGDAALEQFVPVLYVFAVSAEAVSGSSVAQLPSARPTRIVRVLLQRAGKDEVAGPRVNRENPLFAALTSETTPSAPESNWDRPVHEYE